MIDAAPEPHLGRGIIRTYAAPLLAACLLACLPAVLAGCLFDKPAEEVELKLTKVPAGADRIRVVAVDPEDTSKVLAVVYQGGYTQGRTLTFSMGDAAGKDWILKVEGYQRDYLVYLSLVSTGKDGREDAELIPVTRGLPAVFFAGVRRDGDSVRVTVSFRNTPDTLHWHLNPDAAAGFGIFHIPLVKPEISVSAATIGSSSVLITDLHEPLTHGLFPIQEPDTMLGAEALAPAGSAVRIADAYREGDSVHLVLAMENFRLPLVDDPVPGQGFPMVLDPRSFLPIPEFKYRPDDFAHLTAPAWAVENLENLVVALHYSNRMRIRPLAADTIDAAAALRIRAAIPTLQIASHTINGGILTLSLAVTNYQGYHVHIYRESINWPGATAANYQACHGTTCEVGATIWQGATRVVVAIQQDETHTLLRPIISDTLAL